MQVFVRWSIASVEQCAADSEVVRRETCTYHRVATLSCLNPPRLTLATLHMGNPSNQQHSRTHSSVLLMVCLASSVPSRGGTRCKHGLLTGPRASTVAQSAATSSVARCDSPLVANGSRRFSEGASAFSPTRIKRRCAPRFAPPNLNLDTSSRWHHALCFIIYNCACILTRYLI